MSANPNPPPQRMPPDQPPPRSWLARLVDWGYGLLDGIGLWFRRRLLALTAWFDRLAILLVEEGVESVLDRFLNSKWMFGLTAEGARYRRRVFTFLGAFLWAYFAYRLTPPTWDVTGGIAFLTYPFRALFTWTLFPLILLVSLLVQLILLVAWLFVRNVRRETLALGSRLLAVLLAILWALLGSQITHPEWSAEFARNLAAYPFESLFAPRILRHLILAGLSFWAAFRVAAYYLDDIYELEDFSVAERFILQAVFASEYNTIDIRGGMVAPEHTNSPIVRIGGPGYVRVHLDSAAVFENIDGSTRVVGPPSERKDARIPLAGFERLRKAIDLRDFTEEMSVDGRTLDGMQITLENVTVMFSVYRAHQTPTRQIPYPFNPESIRRLVFAQEKEHVKRVAAGMIRRELQEFIGQHTLNEFLASIGEHEFQTAQEQEQELRSQTLRLGGEASLAPVATAPGVTSGQVFKSRPDIMTALFAEQFQHRAAERGVEIHWIGGGTWLPPDEIVPGKHVQAWRLSRENLLRGNQSALLELVRQTINGELVRLVNEVPLRVARTHKDAQPLVRLRQIINTYREKLVEALEVYRRIGSTDGRPPAAPGHGASGQPPPGQPPAVPVTEPGEWQPEAEVELRPAEEVSMPGSPPEEALPVGAQGKPTEPPYKLPETPALEAKTIPSATPPIGGTPPTGGALPASESLEPQPEGGLPPEMDRLRRLAVYLTRFTSRWLREEEGADDVP